MEPSKQARKDLIAPLGLLFSIVSAGYAVVNSNATRAGAQTEWTRSEEKSDAAVTQRLNVQRDRLDAHIAAAQLQHEADRRDIEAEFRREIDLALMHQRK